MLIKRSKIIEALKTEPIVLSNWTSPSSTIETCDVCAVGAIVRVHLGNKLKKMERWELAYYTDELIHDESPGTHKTIDKLIKDKKYLKALSYYFETVFPNAERVDAKGRARLVAFVEAHFPNSFRVPNIRRHHEEERR